jgi:hypothetical protein
MKFPMGKALIATVVRGCGRYGWSVLDWTTPSIAFNLSLGAELHSDWRRMRMTGTPLAALAKATAG